MAAPALTAVDPPDDGLTARLRVTHLLMVEAVLSGDGLARVAAIASEALSGASVAVVVPSHDIAVSAPADGDAAEHLDAVRRYAADSSRGRPRPAGLAVEEPIWSGSDRIGLVALTGAVTPEAFPHARDFLHLVAMAALTEIAIEDARDEVEHNLRGAFFEDLRSGRELGEREIVRRARRLGCDVSHGAVVLCSELSTQRPHHVVAMITGDHPGALAEHLEHRVYAVLPARDGPQGRQHALEAGRRLGVRLERYGALGISGFYPDPADLPRAVEEAELVLEVLRRADVDVSEQIGGGTYRLLFRMLASHPEEVRVFYEETVAPLVRYDQQYRTELVKTLDTYLECDCNMNATAAAAFAHRHTIAYRLDRVKELTGLDCGRTDDRERLSLGLKAYRLLAPELPG